MKCHVHTYSDAVGTCKECNKGLCEECLYLFKQPYCMDCVLDSHKEFRSGVRSQIIISVLMLLGPSILWIFGFFRDIPFHSVSLGIMLLLFYWGMSTFKSIPFVAFLFVPRIAFFGYLVMIFAAPWVGMIYAPIYFIQKYFRWREIKKTEDFIFQTMDNDQKQVDEFLGTQEENNHQHIFGKNRINLN